MALSPSAAASPRQRVSPRVHAGPDDGIGADPMEIAVWTARGDEGAARSQASGGHDAAVSGAFFGRSRPAVARALVAVRTAWAIGLQANQSAKARTMACVPSRRTEPPRNASPTVIRPSHTR